MKINKRQQRLGEWHAKQKTAAAAENTLDFVPKTCKKQQNLQIDFYDLANVQNKSFDNVSQKSEPDFQQQRKRAKLIVVMTVI